MKYSVKRETQQQLLEKELRVLEEREHCEKERSRAYEEIICDREQPIIFNTGGLIFQHSVLYYLPKLQIINERLLNTRALCFVVLRENDGLRGRSTMAQALVKMIVLQELIQRMQTKKSINEKSVPGMTQRNYNKPGNS